MNPTPKRDPFHPIPWLTGAALLALAGLVACSGGAGDSAPTNGGADTGATADGDNGGGADTAAPGDDTGALADAAPTSRDVYPPGPYGIKVGAILPDFAAQGYLHLGSTGVATDADYVALRLSDVRAKAPQRWAMIHEVGFF